MCLSEVRDERITGEELQEYKTQEFEDMCAEHGAFTEAYFNNVLCFFFVLSPLHFRRSAQTQIQIGLEKCYVEV